MAARTLRGKRAAANGEGVSGRPSRRSVDDDAIKQLAPDGLANAFLKAKLHDKSLAVAGLGEPADWEGDMPELPTDIAQLDHHQMSSLLGDLANAMSTALWQASKNYIEADMLDEIAEYLEDIALLDSDESNDTKRKADARTNDSVVTARSMQKISYHNYVRFRDLARTIELKWRTVSRVGGFVGDEAEAETAGAIKRSTRGKAAGNAKGNARGSARARSSR
jgi:hypothetical protein